VIAHLRYVGEVNHWRLASLDNININPLMSVQRLGSRVALMVVAYMFILASQKTVIATHTFLYID
jgi:hypothetical protein